MNKLIVTFIFTLSISISVFGQQFGNTLRPNGYWSGWMQRGGQRYAVSMEIEESNGKWKGIFEMPRMGYYKHELLGIRMPKDSEQVSISLPLPLGSVKLIGTFAGSAFIKGSLEPTTLVAGNWKSLGIDGEFELRRGSKPNSAYEVQEVNFSNGSINLSGSLYLPKGDGPFPAAVFISGSGDAKRGEGGFIADRLARAGIAVLTYDKRGTGESTGNWQNSGFEDLAADATAGLRLISKYSKIDASQSGFICQSQGCWVAPIALRNGAKAKFLISISGPTVSVSDEDLDYYRVTLESGGFSRQDVQKAFELIRTDQKVSLGLKSWDDLNVVIRKYEKEAWFQFLKYAPLAIDAPSRQFGKKILLYDPKKDLDSMKVPSLWLYGTADKIIPVPESVSRIKAKKSKPKPDLLILNNADHSLTVWEQGKLPETASGYPEEIIKWINSKFRFTKEVNN